MLFVRELGSRFNGGFFFSVDTIELGNQPFPFTGPKTGHMTPFIHDTFCLDFP